MDFPGAKKPGINVDPVDRFTLVHGAVGFGLGYARVPWWGALMLSVGWEILENPLKEALPWTFPNPSRDSLANSTFDAIGLMGGWYVAKRLRK